MNNQPTIHETVKAFVVKVLAGIKQNRGDEDALYVAVYDGLRQITAEFTTYAYSFNLAMDIFIEAAFKNFSDYLEKILVNMDMDDDDEAELDVEFAAYYALSLIFKKENNLEGLKRLLGDRYCMLKRYPLYYEVYSRYYKRIDDFRKALDNDKRAINILARRGVVNLAVCISFASTVCSMLEKNSDELHDDEIELAKQYIDDAISFNPDYPKYYFLKAKIVFYSALREGDIETLEAAGKQAKALIEQNADVALYEFYHDRNLFVQEEQAKYDAFKGKIEEIIKRKKSPRFVKSDEELDELKAYILQAESQDECVSSFKLPPVPALHPGDKYFFVCYSSKDFRSVYCDFIELYKHKVPFRYDERLTHGVGWKEQIELYVNTDDCVGVVFYLSKNVLSTGSVCEEMEITEQYGKKHFCVNLEGSKLPSRILSEILIDRYLQDPNNYALPGAQMKLFLNFFGDDEVFTHKFPEYYDEGTKHFDAYIDALETRFPQLVIGD